MERIKQALERARQEREIAPAESARPSHESSAAASNQQITYTQTRTVNIPTRVALSHRLLTEGGSDVVLSAFKMLRTQVLQRMSEHGWNMLAISGSAPGEGKTLVAVNLALSLARKVNHTVLLVDLDLRRPTVHRYLGYIPEVGLSDYLTRDIPLTEVLVNPGLDRLVILPGGAPVKNSSEMLSSPKMIQLVEDLKTRYPSRIVLFDLPPVLSADDAVAFVPYVDAALVVIEEGKTTIENLRRSMSLLQATPVIGTVLNKSRERVTSEYGSLY